MAYAEGSCEPRGLGLSRGDPGVLHCDPKGKIPAKHRPRIARSRMQAASDQATEYEREELRELVRRAIAALPERLRDLIVCTQNRATVKEISAPIGVTAGRVCQLLRGAKRRLRKYLESLL